MLSTLKRENKTHSNTVNIIDNYIVPVTAPMPQGVRGTKVTQICRLVAKPESVVQRKNEREKLKLKNKRENWIGWDGGKEKKLVVRSTAATAGNDQLLKCE